MDDRINKQKEDNNKWWIHPLLFVITLITTTIAGAEWIHGKPLLYFEPGLTFNEVLDGLNYSLPFLAILTVHEFGHFFTARYHNIKVTLPYYIPLWLGFVGLPFSPGTMGAVIRIKEQLKTRSQVFDIGIAGPLAGFVMALFVLYYGFTSLPPPEYIYQIHPEYEQYGADYADHVYGDPGTFYLGNNITFWFFEHYVAPDPVRVPNHYEVIHYPFLFAGFLALFFTALNLLPIGQLDGGHTLYGLVGWKYHKYVSSGLFILLLFYAGLGLVTPYQPVEDLLLYIPLYIGFLYITLHSMQLENRTRLTLAVILFVTQFIFLYIFPSTKGYTGWLVFAFIIGRFLGVIHPPALIDQPLSTSRKILGWITLIVFILCFSPQPFVLIGE